MWHYALIPLLLATLVYIFSEVFSLWPSSIEHKVQNVFSEITLKSSEHSNQQSTLSDAYYNNTTRFLQTQSISDIFNLQVYQGTWTGVEGVSQFNFFNGESGIILTQLQYSNENYNQLYMVLLDPQYDDEKKADIQLNNLQNCMVGQSFSWNCQTTIQAYTYYKRTMQNSMNIPIMFTMNAAPLNVSEPISASNSQFTFTMTSTSSTSLNLSATLTLQDGDFTLMFILYNLFVSAFGVQQILSMKKITKDLEQSNEAYSTKYSMLTVGFITIYDAYVSLTHLYMALEYTVTTDFLLQKIIYLFGQSYFYYFIISIIVYFSLTSVVDMKFLIMIWKNRCFITFTSQQEIRKGFIIFYAKFYVGLITFFALTYFFYLYNEYLLTWPILMIVPQIVHSFMKGNKPVFNYNYAFGTIFSRAIIPFYFRTCPENIRDLAPSLPFSIEYPLIFLFLILVLFLQYKIGPRFFVPRRFKGGYDYFKSYSTSDPLMLEDCPICMSNLLDDPEAEEISVEQEEQNEEQQQEVGEADGNQQQLIPKTNKQQSKPKKLIKKKKIAVTPCNHKYHISCFRAWINVKLECPSCRHILLPIFD